MSSSYFKSLNDEAKKKYEEKLSFNNLPLPDPLDADARNAVFLSEHWPDISIFDIYTYLVDKHKACSRAAFKDFKSLSCYNYVHSNKVKNLRCYRNEIGVCVVTADVEASQKAKKIHMPWIIATHDGEIISGHCTCMAGLGETCSHVGATLFFIQKIVEEEQEKPACTSEPCKWNKTSKKVEPMPVVNIEFQKPKQLEPVQKCADIVPLASDASFKTFLNTLKMALPTAAIFTALSDSEETDSADEDVVSMPTFIEKVRQFLQCLPLKCSLQEKQKYFETKFTTSEDEIKLIATLSKTDFEIWKAERAGRITASNFGKILKCKNSPESLLINIMGYSTDLHTEAIAWGRTMEKTALDKFFQEISPLHVNLSIEPTGLLICKDEPYLGATPDGLITCDCCEDHILEIKCPFTQRSKLIEDIEKKNFFLDDNEILKESHHYYQQVQGQMAVSGVSKCYFVTYTEKQLHYQVVPFDGMLWENSLPTLKKFFYNFVLEEIMDNNILSNLKAAGQHCICKTFRTVVTVNCINCKKTFHSSCVAVTYHKKYDFVCNNCKINALH